MKDSVKARWEEVYRKTEYKVLFDSGTLTFKIGEHNPATEAILRKETGLQREWFIITPCNPRSEQARDELNLFYFNELRYEVESRSGQWIKTLNRDPTGDWPDEPGFLVIDADRLWVMKLGERFYQNAIVTAKLGEAPRLLWLQD